MKKYALIYYTFIFSLLENNIDNINYLVCFLNHKYFIFLDNPYIDIFIFVYKDKNKNYDYLNNIIKPKNIFFIEHFTENIDYSESVFNDYLKKNNINYDFILFLPYNIKFKQKIIFPFYFKDNFIITKSFVVFDKITNIDYTIDYNINNSEKKKLF
jgi:hypothetical protein